jgi:hypothetical protein
MQIALKIQLAISIAHHSINQRVNQFEAFSVLETCHENLDCAASNESGSEAGIPPREVPIEL